MSTPSPPFAPSRPDQPWSPSAAVLAKRGTLTELQSLMQRGILTEPDTGFEYFTGYSYKTLYDWDQYFEGLVLIYMGWPSKYLKNAVRIFLAHQREDGFIARSVPSTPTHDHEHVKPFLAQIAHLVAVGYGELDWLREGDTLERMQRYLDYWLNDMDSRSEGLSDWMSAPHSGMDNQHERAGYWQDRISQGVDLNCYLVREARAFAILHRWVGSEETASRYENIAEQRARRIREKLWDDETGFFFDGNLRRDQDVFCRSAPRGSQLWYPNRDPRIRVRSVSAFAALWAGVATPEQAERMVNEHLLCDRGFRSAYPVPALARDEKWYSAQELPSDVGCNWRTNTWIPTNAIVARGLTAYGYTEHAKAIERSSQQLVANAGLREYYQAETGKGCGLDPFWGWTGLAHFMLDSLF